MAEPFYAAESFYGTQVAFRFEADVQDCEVVGDIPEALWNGSYYRLGPDDAYPTLKGDNLINGDGMASVFHFRRNGAVDYRCRYVNTERFRREKEARRRLYGKYRNAFTDDPSTVGTDRDNTANTNAFYHHGRLFALREDSHPHELDPETLDTLPVCDFDGELRSKTLTAHPKIDPVTGEWWSFGFFAEKRYVGETMFQVIDKNGKIVRQESFITPYPGLMHDFAVTREHVIFPVMPLTVDQRRLREGGDFYAYDPKLSPMYGIMPRNGTAKDLRWYQVPRAFMAHSMNAYTDGSKVHLDAAVAPGNSFRFFNGIDGKPTDPRDGLATISRLTFDLADTNDNVTVEAFPGALGEMPHCDDRFQMSRYRFGFSKAPEGIARLDWETKERLVYSTMSGSPGSAQEPVFVPRALNAPEGDGYILCLVNRKDENRADLVILDALNIEGPATAIVRLPFNQPMAFHGVFVSRSKLGGPQ